MKTMEFFCATCQQRHATEEIAADMWSICQPKLEAGVEKVIGKMRANCSGDENTQNLISDLSDELSKFIKQENPFAVEEKEQTAPEADQDEEEDVKISNKIRFMFALNRKAIAGLKNRQRKGRVVSGIYGINLGQLLQAYDQIARDKSGDIVNKIRERNWQIWLDEEVYSLDVRVYLDENGTFQKITDDQDSHFERKFELVNPETQKKEQRTVKLGFRRICSHCGRILSSVAGCADEIVVALAGSPRAGKTSCMVAMISALQDQRCAGVSVAALGDDETMAEIGREVGAYQKCEKVTKTSDKQEKAPTYSILLTMKLNKDQEKEEKKASAPQKTQEIKKVLTIVDMPGEFWQGGEGLSDEFFRQYSGLYMNIDCIWLVTSKATIRLSQTNIPDEDKNRLLEETSEDATVVYQANPTRLETNLHKLKIHMEAHGKQVPPVLTIISKPDYVVSKPDREATISYALYPLEREATSEETEEIKAAVMGSRQSLFKGVREKHMFDHAKSVRDYIRKSNAHFLGAVENNCPDRFYTSMSAYGKKALEPGKSKNDTPAPYHVLYPLFWTLMITGAAKVYHKTKWQNYGLFGKLKDPTREEIGLQYRYDKVQALVDRADNKQEKKDREIIYRDIESNLLTHGENYAESVIDHPRRGG